MNTASNHCGSSPDPWRKAFDALLSKPENFPRVWKLRFLDNELRGDFAPWRCSMPNPVDNLLVGVVNDVERRRHFVVVNDQPIFIYPGEGSACYYFFDTRGNFQLGSVLNTGHRCGHTNASLNPAGTVLTIRNFFNDDIKDKIETSFSITEHGLMMMAPIRDGIGCGKVIFTTE